MKAEMGIVYCSRLVWWRTAALQKNLRVFFLLWLSNNNVNVFFGCMKYISWSTERAVSGIAPTIHQLFNSNLLSHQIFGFHLHGLISRVCKSFYSYYKVAGADSPPPPTPPTPPSSAYTLIFLWLYHTGRGDNTEEGEACVSHPRPHMWFFFFFSAPISFTRQSLDVTWT